MSKLPTEDRLVALIDAATQGKSDHRSHLGASIIGHECEKFLWLTFRHAISQVFPGRIKRLFRRGQNEEATVISDLRDAGMSMTECLHQQKLHYIAPHVGCTPDGLLTGHPDAPKSKHSLECKTHSLKSFNDVSKDGVEKSKPQHYAQMQCEMVAQKTDRALYFAVCKDDDRIYTERVKLDKDAADAIIARGHRITLSDRIPEPCAGASASWYVCKMCAGYSFCHETHLTTEVNCRTCCHSTATEAGTWTCAKYDCDIPFLNQLEGCESHVLHPDLVPWQLDSDASTESQAVWIIDGKPVANGEADAHVYGSKELVANAKACANPDELMTGLREDMGARVIG